MLPHPMLLDRIIKRKPKCQYTYTICVPSKQNDTRNCYTNQTYMEKITLHSECIFIWCLKDDHEKCEAPYEVPWRYYKSFFKLFDKCYFLLALTWYIGALNSLHGLHLPKYMKEVEIQISSWWLFEYNGFHFSPLTLSLSYENAAANI